MKWPFASKERREKVRVSARDYLYVSQEFRIKFNNETTKNENANWKTE